MYRNSKWVFLIKSSTQSLCFDLCLLIFVASGYHIKFDLLVLAVSWYHTNLCCLILQHLQSNAPLLYFWYAEAELANSSGNTQELSPRALYILSCLGTGAKYYPFEHKPSSLQLLRAHQGFKEKLRTVQLAWVCGVVDDQSVALICSAALFEELTTGWAAGIGVLEEALTMVLPGL